MSFWAQRRYAWSRVGARVGARPWAFAGAVLLAGAALMLPLMLAAMWPVVAAIAAATVPRAEVSVFVTVGTAGSEVRALAGRVAALPLVTETAVVGRDAALAAITARPEVSTATKVIAELKTNPLPDVIVASVRPHTAADAIDAAAEEIRRWSRVDTVVTDTRAYRRAELWFGAARATVVVGSVLMLLLTCWALTVAARWPATNADAEDEVLELVGADRAFVRRPRVYAAAITLALAMVIALAAGELIRSLAGPQIAAFAALYGTQVAPVSAVSALGLLAVVGAGFVGATLGWVGPRRRRRT